MKRRGFAVKRLTVAAILLAVLGCATLGGGDNVKQASAHYQIGVSYLNDNNIQPAFIEFQKAMKLDPRNKEVLNAIGLIYLVKLEDYPQAIAYFQKALDIDENFSEASNNLGLAYEKMGRFYDAIECYKTAVSNRLYRNAQKAFTNLGWAYYRVKRFQDAIDSYKDAIRRFSDFYQPYYGLSLAYNAIGHYSDAATALERALELDPEYKGDREKARKSLEDRKLAAKGDEQRDMEDLLEIMNY